LITPNSLIDPLSGSGLKLKLIQNGPGFKSISEMATFTRLPFNSLFFIIITFKIFVTDLIDRAHLNIIFNKETMVKIVKSLFFLIMLPICDWLSKMHTYFSKLSHDN